ncbi:Protoheme IX farnesyltransferase, mitochondrial [Tilletia horrida]|nr:Protoheme IX farnesyltransferase, mitochondrial [Tilletia horrida]
MAPGIRLAAATAAPSGVRRVLSPAFPLSARRYASHNSNTNSAESRATVPADLKLSVHESSIALTAPSLGLTEPFHFDHHWLRDASPHPRDLDPATSQKLFHTSDVPINPAQPLLDPASPPPAITPENTVRIAWNPATPLANAFSALFSRREPLASSSTSAASTAAQPHIVDYPIEYLLSHASAKAYDQHHADVGGLPRPWLARHLHPSTTAELGPSDFIKALASGSSSQDLLLLADQLSSRTRPLRVAWSALDPDSKATAASGPEAETARKLALFTLLASLLRDGVSFVTGLPTSPTGPQTAYLNHLASLTGEIRHTFYGHTWNVRSLGAASRNIAYTNLDLGLHMDLLYFAEPPRFQFLHMLRNKVRGGESIFVDSFAVAEMVWKQDREAWNILADTPVEFHYENDGRHYRFTHPTFVRASRSTGLDGAPLPSIYEAGSGPAEPMPRLACISYSPPFQAPIPLHPPHLRHAASSSAGLSLTQRAAFFSALDLFARLSLSEEVLYEHRMQEGECVIFDNRRVLHSRRGFEGNEDEASVPADEQDEDAKYKRWLKGCYVDGDAVWSAYRALRTQLRKHNASR